MGLEGCFDSVGTDAFSTKEDSAVVTKGIERIALAIMIFLAPGPWAVGESGIDAPSAIGPFLNGNLPSPNDKVGSGSWELVEAFPGLTFKNLIHLTSLPSSNKLLVIEHQGQVYAFENGADAASSKRLVLDITDRVQKTNWGGLLSMVFHPEFGDEGSPNRGYVYLFYRYTPDPAGGPGSSNTHGVPGYARVSRFEYDFDVEEIDPSSESVLIQQYDTSKHHLGGALVFGDDGFLYISRGDEYCCNDPTDATQKISKGFFSGVLRIDVDQDPSKSHPIRRQPEDNSSNRPWGWPASYSQGYYVPNDNPWVDPSGGTLEEFYAIGLRSPHSMTYDAVSGYRFVADVGESRREEVNVLEKGGNYQWAFREGDVAGPKPKPATVLGTEYAPVHSYGHSNGANCIIGGHVYRGSEHPSLVGKYIFADNGNQQVSALTYTGGQLGQAEYLCTATPGSYYTGISGIGIDSSGEIYILKMAGHDDSNGKIYKFSRDEPSVPEPPALLSETGAFQDLANLEPAPGVIPYAVNTPLYSDGALKRRWLAVPNDGSHDTSGEQIDFSETGNWTFPDGTVLIKHFELPIDENDGSAIRRLETRFMLLGAGGETFGFTYRWRPDGSDADLLTDSFEESVPVSKSDGSTVDHVWYYPSRTECYSCHSTSLGYVLGVRTRQLNRNYFYDSTGRTSNQLETLNHLGIFNPPIDTSRLPELLTSQAIEDRTASLQKRVLSYLDSNCAHCHQDSGTAHTDFDARLIVAPTAQDIVDGVPNNTLDIPGAKIVAPKDVEKSILHRRVNSLEGCCAMPPLAKNAVDAAAVSLIVDWIDSLDGAVAPPTPDAGDLVPPVPSLTAPEIAIGSFVVEVDFSEHVYGLEASDFEVTNGQAVALNGSEASYELTVAPASPGPVTVTLRSDSAIDSGENANPPSNEVSTASEDPPVISIASASAGESVGELVFAVGLSAVVSLPVEVDFTTSADSASAAEDFTLSSGTLTIAAGQTTAEITVPLVDDLIDEPNESFTVELTGAELATIGAGVATGTIIDDDQRPVISIADATAIEGGTLVFSLALSNPSSREISVAFATAGDTAFAGSDFTAKSGTVTLSPEQTSYDVAVSLLQDDTDEGAETLLVTLSDASNASIGQAEAVGVILDNDDPPVADLQDGEAVEGDEFLVLPVSLSAASEMEVSLDYVIASGTAESTVDLDSTPGSITIAPGEVAASIAVPLIGDAIHEGPETFSVKITGGQNVSLGSVSASGTILDDERPPAIHVSSATANEADGSLLFNVSLSGESSRPITFRCETAGETASADDFVSEAADLTIPAGQTQLEIPVEIQDDTIDEPDETIVLKLTNSENTDPEGTIGIGTIVDNDDSPEASVVGSEVTEGAEAVRFTVELSEVSGHEVTIRFNTRGGTATAGVDFEGTSGTVTIPAGQRVGTVLVALLSDELDESDETVFLQLSDPEHVTIAESEAVSIIVDDEDLPMLSIASVAVAENEGKVDLVVTSSGESAVDIEAEYKLVTESAGVDDFEPMQGTLTIPAGSQTATLSVLLTEDSLDEADETFVVQLVNATSAALGANSSASVTIQDDDDPPTMSVGDVTATEDTGTIEIDVRLDRPSGREVRVTYRTVAGTAREGSDFQDASGTIEMEAGTVAAQIAIPVLDDSVDEDVESFTVFLEGAVHATLGGNEATVTIVDDDEPRDTKPIALEVDQAETRMTWLWDPETEEAFLEIAINGVDQADDYDFLPELSGDLSEWENPPAGDLSVEVGNESVRVRLRVTDRPFQFIRFRILLRED